MEEEVLQSLYTIAKENGYMKDSFEFQKLMNDDEEARKTMYDISLQEGYTKSFDEFTELVTPSKKKIEESVGEMEPMVSKPEVDSSDTSQEDRESFSYKSYLKDILGGAYSLATFSPAKFAAKSLGNIDYKNIYETGVAQGAGAREILSAVYLGKDIGSEEAKQFAEAANRLESIGPSDSMIQFDKDYEDAKENYGGALASIVALGKNPEVATETILTSMIAAGRMGPEAIPELIGTTLAGTGTGFAVAGPAGIIPGAAGGLRFGVGSILDGTMSMIEFTREELGEKPFTPENIQELFQDEKRFKKIRNRALSRGITIGAIEAFAGLAAGKIAKPIAKVGIEAAGGGIGEVAARVAASQEMDAREILLETVGGLAGAPATLAEGFYKINKQPTTAEQTEQIIDEVDAKDLRDIDITIENDDNLSSKYNEKIQKQKISEDIDPDVPEENRDQIIDLEYQRKKLENKNTVSAKEKVKQIDEKIKELSIAKEETAKGEEVIETEPTYNVEKTVDEKNGVTTTKFNKFKNGRKMTIGEEKASVLEEMGYEILDPENTLEGLEVIGVSEIRESEEGASATISVRDKNTGLIDRGFNFVLKKKTPSKKRVDKIVDEIITKTEARLTKDVDPKKKLRNVKSYLQGSKFYQEATDIERESAIRELNEKLGLKIKRPPSVKKILGAPKAEKVSVDPRVILKERMGELQRATKQAAKFTKEELSSYQTQIKDLIKEVGKKGQLSKAQTIAMTNRVLKPSFTEKSIANTLDYIDRIYENAELAERILSLNKMQKTAKKNAPKKIGAAIDVIAPLQKVLQIKPINIPLDIIDDYESILNQVGQRKSVLDLEGKVDLISRINNVLENYEAEVSRPVEPESKETKAFDVDEVVSQIDTQDIDESNFQIRDERDHVRKFKSYSSDDFKMLPESLIKKLPAVVSNVSNGFVTKDVTEIINTIEAKKSEQNVHDVASKTYKRADIRLAFSRMYGKLNEALSKNKSAILSEISNNPTFVIDDIFGNIGGKEIYNATFGKLAKSYATYEAELRSVKANYFDKAEKILQKGKIGVRNRNDVYKSKVKIMTYMLEREYKSNPGSDKVASALDFINATIKEINKPKSSLQLQYNIPVLEEIKNNFTVDEAIDEKKLINSMTDQEKQALSLIKEGNKSLREKAIFTSGVIRGSMPEIINDYIHHDVLITERSKLGNYLSEAQEVFLNPSTKAGTLLERQPGAKPISFDPISSSNAGARKTLLDYHLTSPLSQVRKSISGLNKIEGTPKDLAQAYNALEVSMNDVLEKVFLNNFQETTFLEEALGALKTIGYRAALASAPRAVGETASNLTYIASVGAKPFSVGISKYSKYLIGNPQEAIDIMKNLKSEQQSRLYDPSRIAAKDANTGVFTREKIGSGKAMSDLRNKISYIVDNTYVPASDFVGEVQDRVIETPDKALSRPLWFGNFDRQFTKLTGKSPDMQKIQANDETYMSENKENLDKATKFADEESTRAAASVNPFNTIPKNLPSPKDVGTLRGLVKQANAYMTRFLIYEYTTARTAAISAFMGGKMPRAKAFATLGGVTMRMSSYMILTSYLKDLMLSLFGYEEEEKDLEEMFTRQTIGSILSLAMRRTVGNIPAIPINMAIEYVNEEYLEGLRSGEKYDPYEHSLVFSQVKLEDLQRKSITDLGVDVASGPYGSMVRSLDRFTKVSTGLSKSKRISTKERYQRELEDRMLIEALGHLNLLPFYKDFRTFALKRQFEGKKKK
jgi:hypothetical protein